jgi:hypothetical protein
MRVLIFFAGGRLLPVPGREFLPALPPALPVLDTLGAALTGILRLIYQMVTFHLKPLYPGGLE